MIIGDKGAFILVRIIQRCDFVLGLFIKVCLVFAVVFAQGDCALRTADEPVRDKKTEVIMENEQKHMPQLKVNYSVNETSLEVEYKLKNTGDAAIYLFNIIPSQTAADQIAQQPFYSCLRDDGTLVLAKMIPKLPSIASVEFREIPFVTRVDAGQEFAEKVSVSIPIEEYSPYFMKLPDSKVEQRPAESVVFILQFIREKDELKVKEANIPNGFSVWHPDLFGNVETISTDPRVIAVNVERRLDTFERF